MDTRAYAVKLLDSESLQNSSSGGAFTAISNIFLKNGGAIASPIYNYTSNQAEFVLYTSQKKRDSARGSKYMQAYPLNIFKEAENWIKSTGKTLLFVGTGCQADGFRRFSEVRGFRNKVVIVDLICHGVPSPAIWKDYVEMILKGGITNLSFRDKRNGWRFPTAVVKQNGKEKSVQEYLPLFYSRCALRPSCYQCPYATTERSVDITIGDFWGIEKSLPDFDTTGGVSLVLVHTPNGQAIFEKLKQSVKWQECSVSSTLQPNLVAPTEKSPKRDKFWEDYRAGGIKRILKKYARDPLPIVIFRSAKNAIKKILFWTSRIIGINKRKDR